ncbi:MAG: DUF4145 domain-containing protein [bacterium]|nr:DUF4145 domain-containing protein [Candidatus Limimorpha caballi]
MEQKTVNCYCPVCKHRTHHEVLGVGNNVSPDEEYFYNETYRVVKCCGCDHVSFDLEVVEEGNVEYDQEGYETLVPVHTSYPVKENSVEPISSWEMPSLIQRAYKESVEALNNGSFLLASIGFRATVEALCIENGLDKGTLNTKINKLRDKGIITAADCERLHEARFMGNESAHQIEKPDRQHVLIVLEVINNILNNLYVIDKKFKDVIEYRFKDYAEFQALIEKGIDEHPKGAEGTIYMFLPEERKYRKTDLDKYEAELQQHIADGTFTKLSVLPKPKDSKYRQGYRVE